MAITLAGSESTFRITGLLWGNLSSHSKFSINVISLVVSVITWYSASQLDRYIWGSFFDHQDMGLPLILVT